MYRSLPSTQRAPKSATSQSTITNQTPRLSKDTRTCLPAHAPPAIVAEHALAADVVAAG